MKDASTQTETMCDTADNTVSRGKWREDSHLPPKKRKLSQMLLNEIEVKHERMYELNQMNY